MKYAWFATPVRRSRIASSSNHAYFMKRLKDRKSTRLNSSHGYISYAVFCLKKKKLDDPRLAQQVLDDAREQHDLPTAHGGPVVVRKDDQDEPADDVAHIVADDISADDGVAY